MRSSFKANDATIVQRSSDTRTRFAIAALLFLLTACRTPAPVETDTDANTDVDTDTAVEELACGPNTPPSCDELIDGVCFGAELPPPFTLSSVATTDEDISRHTRSAVSCGFRAYVTCAGGRFIGRMVVSEEGSQDGETPVLYEGESIYARAIDAETRLEVAMGILPDSGVDAPCKRHWFGERDAYPCFEELIDLLYERYAGCTHNAEPCDYCGCRVNEVTDVQFPGCDVEGE